MRANWLLLLLATACSKDNGAALAAGGSGARDVLLNAWKHGGLEVSAMAPKPVSFGKDCQGGTVNGVEVVVCAYATPAEAKAAEDTGLTLVGEATGISQAKGAVLIVAVDRTKADPNGRTLNKLTKLAPK